jgi:RNA polymerase sigma factor (sigma-70 family)
MNDRLLGARLRAGDDSALAEIFDQLGPLVFGLARRLTGSPAMAEDVMQEVFTALWTQPDRFDPERGSLRAYLGLMSHRRSVDAVRRSSRRQLRENKVGGLVPAAGVQEDTAEATAVSESVRAALAQLPGDQRRAVELAFWQQVSRIAEIPHCRSSIFPTWLTGAGRVWMSVGQFVAITSWESKSVIDTGSPQHGHSPPRPILRMKVQQSGQRCSPSARLPQSSHS